MMWRGRMRCGCDDGGVESVADAHGIDGGDDGGWDGRIAIEAVGIGDAGVGDIVPGRMVEMELAERPSASGTLTVAGPGSQMAWNFADGSGTRLHRMAEVADSVERVRHFWSATFGPQAIGVISSSSLMSRDSG